MCSNIMSHLDHHKLLSDRQHAFRKSHSCETQLATVIDDWAKILDNQGQVDTFILDFEKAFDTPPHELLKSKLFSYGIGGKTIKWIDAFLCYRQQRVVVNGVKSDWAPVVSGVPQGTVLGPLLFSLHINDITSDIESEIRLFADDCVCYREIKNVEDTVKLQKDIDRLGSWARKWGMRFQPVKCNMMQLTNKRTSKIQASYKLEGTVLENVESIKYLGVTITKDLKWNTHISNVCTKANRTLGFLRRNLFSCPQDVREAAYKGLVRPILEYGSSVWDPHYEGLIDDLEKVQKRAARFVTRNYTYEKGSMIGILKKLKWESLQKRRKDNRIILLYKGLKGRTKYPRMTLSPKIGVVGINTPWHFRYLQQVQMTIYTVSSPRPLEIGMNSLNPSKALGPDELHPRVLKELAVELGPVFAHLFQQSIDTGEIPKEWSLANICPLFKKGDRSLARNYRPVSLTCIPCKLLEHIVCSNIMAHLDEHELLSDRQHAFRKWHSCETQLTTVINDWAKILDKKGQVDTFILDFEKAFDTPPHELLKSKLFSYGIGGTTLNWINAFLCFRQQRVVVNGIKSDWAPVVSGVPQGTVLGPLLFSLYINDISADIESEITIC